MPTNYPLGQTVPFTALFWDANGNLLTNVTSATLTINYPLVSNSLTITSCSIGMSQSGNTFTASWASSVAAAGLSSYSVAAPGLASNAPGNAGTLRLM